MQCTVLTKAITAKFKNVLATLQESLTHALKSLLTNSKRNLSTNLSMFSPFLNDLDDDPFFGAHMSSMSNMMNSMNQMVPMHPMNPMNQMTHMHPMTPMTALNPMASMNQMNPFYQLSRPNDLFLTMGNSMFPRGTNHMAMPFSNFGMNNMFPGPMMPSGGNHSYSTSTVISMSQGPDGRPQVYKSSSSVKSGPGGIRETQRSEINSVSGTKKMAIGHHIGDKAHVIEKQQNLNTGDQEENEELVNLDDDELDEFKKEWETKARQYKPRDRQLRITDAEKIQNIPLALPPALSQTYSNPQTSGRRPHCSSSGHSRKNRNFKSVSGQNERTN